MVGCSQSPWGRWGSDMTEWLHFHFSPSCTGEGNDNPLQCSCLENPRDGGAWWAAVYGVAQNRTRLKWVSSREGKVVLPYKILIFLILNASMLFLVQTSNHFLTKTIQVRMLTIRTEGLLNEGNHMWYNLGLLTRVFFVLLLPVHVPPSIKRKKAPSFGWALV